MIANVTKSTAGQRGPGETGGPPRVWLEVAGIGILLGVTAFFLVTSWRRWNHPLIDFGRELYIPWRLSEGAVLYRDVDDVYGPLSQYFNAAIFKLFGPGLMVLVTANLVVVTAILTLGYALFRQAWGMVGAFAAGLVFVSIFAFSQFLAVSNFNYVTPYAHEATHGVLVTLALTVALNRWREQPTRWKCLGAGLLFGLTWVLKPEFMLAGGVVTTVAFVLARRRLGGLPSADLAVFIVGALAPTACFSAYFSRYFPLFEAVEAAGRAWSSLLIHPDIVAKKYQLAFLGFDDPWSNLVVHLRSTLLAVLLLGALGGLIAFALRRTGAPLRWGLLALTMVGALVVGWNADWGSVGRCLLGLNLLYLALSWYGLRRRTKSGAEGDWRVADRRILLGVLATALMSRMVLSGRVHQFGFYQAAMAAMVVVAVICAQSAEWMPDVRGRRRVVALVAAGLVLPGIVLFANFSQRYLRAQTYAVGEGRDRFCYFPADIDAAGSQLNAVLEVLHQFPPGFRLLALPEGEMINYLARRPSPLPQFQYYSFTTEGGRESAVVSALNAHAPELVVIFGRDLRDFGVARYGERDGAGREIVQWLSQHYRITHHFGGDPLSSEQRGAYVLQLGSSARAEKR